MGGPAGAATGAAVGAVFFALDESFEALANTGFGFSGPNNNWCFITTGRYDHKNKISIGTYREGDTWLIKTYWTEYKNDNSHEFVMSAGQARDDSFQVRVWDRDDNCIAHIEEVYFRDMIWTHRGYVIHGKGELHEENAGQVDLIESC